jgi:cation diffusion facilitator family transporter
MSATTHSREESKKNVRLQIVIVVVGAALLIAKFFAYHLTRSNTVLTDALESIVNVVAGALGLYSLIIAAMPKDENHPYGHGKIEFISAGVEGTLIIIAGVLIVIKSVESLFFPQELQQIDMGIYITAAAGGVNYVLGFWAMQQGKRSNSLALVASGKHLISDTYSTIGLVIGLLLIWATEWLWLDSATAILFGFIIAFTGYHIIKESIAGIMDEVDYRLVQRVIEVLQANRQPNWIDIHNLRIIKYGGALHIDCHLTVPRFFNVVEAHDEVDALELVLEEKIQPEIELFIHIDACVPDSCRLCPYHACPVRSSDFEALEDWTLFNIMQNRKHGLAEQQAEG